MKKYIVTEEWIEGGHTPGWNEIERKELPPNAQVLTRRDIVDAFYRAKTDLGSANPSLLQIVNELFPEESEG